MNLPAPVKCFKLGCILKRHVLKEDLEVLVDCSRKKIFLPLFGVGF